MKKLSLPYLLTALLFAFLLPATVKATHCAGGELTYAWLHDSTYQFTLHFYRDCSGSPGAGPFPLCYYNAQGQSFSAGNMAQVGQPVEVSTSCPGYSTTCSTPAGVYPGYQEYIYTATVILPSKSQWTFYTYLGNRNTSINTTNQPYFYIDCMLDNLNAQGQSSPYFSVRPVPYMCINQPYSYNNGAIDPNNDSLAYEMIAPREILNISCNSNPGANSILLANFNLTNNPFPTGNTFVLSPTLGQMSFTPSQAGASTVTIKVKKYRNGLLIGTVLRDIQLVVLGNCNAVQPTLSTISSTVTGAITDTLGRLLGCAGQPLHFCFDSKSSDTSARLVVSSNNAVIAPGSTLTYNNTYADSVNTCFDWTPGILDTGVRNLIVTVKDSACHNPGLLMQQAFVIPIYIAPITQILKDTTICPYDSVKLTAVGGSSFTWTVLPGGSSLSTLSCTNCKSPVARPTMTTQYVVTSNNLSYCNRNKDTVTITVVTPANISAGPDTTTCINNSLQLNINLVPSPGTTYNVKWTPSTYLDNDSIPNPVTTPKNDMVYYVKVAPNGLSACASYDTISVRVLQGYKLYTPDTAICAGSTLNVNLLGDNRYNYNWTPNNGVSSTTDMAPSITPDTSHLYTVTASYPGCRDSVSKFFLDLQPIPTVYAGPDQTLCYGDTMTLRWTTVSPSSYPNYIYDWNPGGALNDPAKMFPLFTAYADATLTFTASTPAGCKASDDIKLTVKRPKFMTVSADTLLCPGDTAQLHVTGDAVSVIWNPKSYISNDTSFDPTVYPTATTDYTVVGRDKDNCADTLDVNVTVKPMAVINLPDSTTIFPGESYQMDPGGNCLYFSWFPPLGLSATNIPNPLALPSVNTRYFVKGTTEYGCIVNDSIDVFVSPESFIDVPNAFAPGTGPNNKIMPVHRGNVTLKSFIIYNRWGSKMFETNRLDDGWDGRFNGQTQPMGVYVYMVEAVTPTGKRFYKQGNITLLR
ncbi:T9SS type B sorting domain-containing protein [Taibaiella soli]|nr:gliding motility-associated C-terminal domain-containing protein [Taibaiella soli]